jgi:hypothetical protein
MRSDEPDRCAGALAFIAVAAALTACATQTPVAPAPQAPPPAQVYPPAYRSEEITGRWGLAAYHKPDDRARTEAAARNQCKNPYVITMGPDGGVMMHLADSAKAQELVLKGGPGGKTYIGPPGEPGGPQDREFVSFDGRVMILRFVDPEVAGRYGTMVYVRCGPRA